MIIRKKILFVGAGGQLASKILPLLAERYDVVGIAGKRDSLRRYCVDMYSGNLLTDYEHLFEAAFRWHQFDAIIWNPVRYFSTPLLESTREGLHTEFDLAVALPVECLKMARRENQLKGVFVIVSSMAAFIYRKDLASYSIIKKAQIRLAEILSDELEDIVALKVIAPANVNVIKIEDLLETFVAAIENQDPEQTFFPLAREL